MGSKLLCIYSSYDDRTKKVGIGGVCNHCAACALSPKEIWMIELRTIKSRLDAPESGRLRNWIKPKWYTIEHYEKGSGIM